MRILGIETSCDETAISIIETEGALGQNFNIKILANEILSQIEIHRQYGGVFPMVAKREHSRNLIPLLKLALKNAGFENSKSQIAISKQIQNSKSQDKNLESNKTIYSQILQNLRIDPKRESELWEQFEKEIPILKKPPIDLIAVTRGPGLEPALWTGINLAKALATVWNIPLMPVNHMEGHVFASLLRHEENPKFQKAISKQIPNPKLEEKKENSLLPATSYKLQTLTFPAIALLISGGHTELILIKDWLNYEIIGATLDDAVGEAFDKVARVLGLPYPGGPEISKLAETWRVSGKNNTGITFPRPMLKSGDLNFSFSGLKTSVLYTVKKISELTPDLKSEIATAFEDAVIETVVEKTKKAILKNDAKTLIVGGGVAANKLLREKLTGMTKSEQAEIFISEISHSTDNALMIAIAGAVRQSKPDNINTDTEFRAEGGYRIDKIK